MERPKIWAHASSKKKISMKRPIQSKLFNGHTQRRIKQNSCFCRRMKRPKIWAHASSKKKISMKRPIQSKLFNGHTQLRKQTVVFSVSCFGKKSLEINLFESRICSQQIGYIDRKANKQITSCKTTVVYCNRLVSARVRRSNFSRSTSRRKSWYNEYHAVREILEKTEKNKIINTRYTFSGRVYARLLIC